MVNETWGVLILLISSRVLLRDSFFGNLIRHCRILDGCEALIKFSELATPCDS